MSIVNIFLSKTIDELKILNISHYKLVNASDLLKEALKYFENHPSILNMKSNSPRADTFFWLYSGNKT